jgi:hypothetical protein
MPTRSALVDNAAALSAIPDPQVQFQGDEAPLAVLLFCSELSAIDLPFPAEILDRPRFDDQRTARRWLFHHCFSLFSGRNERVTQIA